jgi:hypothetical protein
MEPRGCLEISVTNYQSTRPEARNHAFTNRIPKNCSGNEAFACDAQRSSCCFLWILFKNSSYDTWCLRRLLCYDVMWTCTVLLTTYPAPYHSSTWSSFVTAEDRFSSRVVHVGCGPDLLHRGSHIPVESQPSILHCVSTAVSALAIAFKAQYSYEQTYAYCELTVIELWADLIGLWVDRDRTVSGPWSDVEWTVIGCWVDRDRTFSGPWSDVEWTVIRLSGPWSDCKWTVIRCWVDRDRTLSGPWSDVEWTVVGRWVDRNQTVSGPWSDCEWTVIGLWVDRKQTVNLSIVEVGTFYLQIGGQTFFLALF